MKRTAKKLFVAAAIAAVSIQSVPTASACGGRGGRVSYAPVYGGYARAASNYRTTLPTTPPIHNAAPRFNPALGHAAPPAAITQPASTASTVASVRPRPRAQVALQSSAAPQQTLPQQATTQPTTTPTTSTPAANRADAESSALAALASLTASKPTGATSPAPSVSNPAPTTTTAVAASAATPGHIGSFQATLPSNVTIELNLNSSNTFSWVVRNNGKTSQFTGQYRVTEGRLTLVRSNDLQKMEGKLTMAANGFTFQLDGANNAGLEFKKVA